MLRKLLALALTASLLAACSDDDGDTATEDTTTTAAETTTTETTESSGTPTVTVEDPGQEPRRELRLDLQVGDTDQVTQRQEVSIEVQVADQTQAAPSPTTELDLGYEVTSVDGDVIETVGRFEDVRVADEAGADPSAVAQITELLEGFRTARAHATVDPQGAVLSSEIEGLDLGGAGGAVAEQFATSLADVAESLSMPFPEEPIGAGARWRVESEAEIAGIRVAVTTTMQLDELTDERAAGTVQQAIRFIPGDVEVFGTPATVISGDLKAAGTVEWDLVAGIVPRSDITTEGTSVIEAAGTQLQQTQRQRIVVTAR